MDNKSTITDGGSSATLLPLRRLLLLPKHCVHSGIYAYYIHCYMFSALMWLAIWLYGFLSKTLDCYNYESTCSAEKKNVRVLKKSLCVTWYRI